jgi:class 3 adenylate cyclase
MQQVASVPVRDANRFARLRAYRGGQQAPDRIEATGAAGFVPFAGLNSADGNRGHSLERTEIEEMLSVLERFVTRPAASAKPRARVLATVLFTDIVDSTERAAALGDRAWTQTLNRHDEIARSAVGRCMGRLIKGTGDGVLATFDSPAHGIDCARALRVELSHAGIAIRAGVHTGEVEMRGDDVSGIGIHIAARVTALAGAGELLVSRTVRDLVAGAGYEFVSRGAHALKGVPDRWELLAVR